MIGATCRCQGTSWRRLSWEIPGLSFSTFQSTFIMFWPANSAKFCSIVSQGSVYPIYVFTLCRMLPESNLFFDIQTQLTPDYFYPFAIAWKIGAPPLYLGRREGCTTIIPISNKSITSSGIRKPYEHTTPRAGFWVKLDAKSCHSSLLLDLSVCYLMGVWKGRRFCQQQIWTQLVSLRWGGVQWVMTWRLGK